jgi:hypothetical protein
MSKHRNPRASVSKQPTPDNPVTLRIAHISAASTEDDARNARNSRPDFEYHMNGLRLAIGRTDAVADALQRYFDERRVTGPGADVAERRASHLIDMTAECAVRACDELELACEAIGWEGDDE